METSIPCHEVVGRLGDDEVLVLDCRSEEDWRQLPVQMPGALRMTVLELRDCVQALPDDELIVLVDADEPCDLARHAWRILTLSGRTAVCLQGGLSAWISAGLPTERADERRRSRSTGYESEQVGA